MITFSVYRIGPDGEPVPATDIDLDLNSTIGLITSYDGAPWSGSIPEVTELGGGRYGFDDSELVASAQDGGGPWVWVLNLGQAVSNRYASDAILDRWAYGLITDPLYPGVVVAFEDNLGYIANPGVDPELPQYNDFTGAPLTPPAWDLAAIPIGPGFTNGSFYVLRPAPEDYESGGVSYLVARPDESLLPLYIDGELVPDAPPEAPGADVTSPTVQLQSTPEGALQTTQPIIVDVKDETAMRATVLMARLPGRWDVVFDGVNWGPDYLQSRRQPISQGQRYTVERRGGWPAGGVKLAVRAIDTSGNEA